MSVVALSDITERGGDAPPVRASIRPGSRIRNGPG